MGTHADPSLHFRYLFIYIYFVRGHMENVISFIHACWGPPGSLGFGYDPNLIY